MLINEKFYVNKLSKDFSGKIRNIVSTKYNYENLKYNFRKNRFRSNNDRSSKNGKKFILLTLIWV